MVRFLPPRTTSRIQPCHAGIIACVKSIYKKRLLKRVLDNIDSDSEDIYETDVLTALQWITHSWDEVTQETIKGFWSHCFEHVERCMEQINQACVGIDETSKDLGRIDIDDLLNPFNENDGLEKVSNDALCQTVIYFICPIAGIEEEAPEPPTMTVSANLKALGCARRVL